MEQNQKDYREYIESWVHEIKAPITAIALNCENNRDERSRYLLVENRKVENYVDMALYYARMDAVYKDYMIAETNLQEVAQQVLLQNKYYLIQSHVNGGRLHAPIRYTAIRNGRFYFKPAHSKQRKIRKK